MKRFKKLILMVTLASFLMMSMFGCYGSFTFTKKLYEFNGSVSGNKFVNNLVFWLLGIAQIYSFTAVADVAVLNLIEFWTGSNPMAMADGVENIQYVTIDGSEFKLLMSNDTLSIETMSGANKGAIVELNYDAASQSWYLQQQNGSVKVATMHGDKLDLIYPSGNILSVDVSY
ncbi:MAG: DUF3332 domain-containing protein [Candidatus Cloacimonadaceae bacterium]|jgi:hypothetical protein